MRVVVVVVYCTNPLFSFSVFFNQFIFCAYFHSDPFRKNNIVGNFIKMSEKSLQDENSVATEQNSMVQRIALEVKRREPSSVNIIFLPYK